MSPTYGEAVDWLRARQALNESRVCDIVLLGELGTTYEDLEQAADAIGTVLQFRGPSSAQTAFSRSYRLVLAEFVVAAGVHNYSHGNYWSWLQTRVGLPQQNYPTKWGELFEQVLVDHGLEQFGALRDERASRFVAKILAHGGIPTYCLPDFFEHLLIPAVRSGEHRESPPADLIDLWANRPSALVVVDKPVKRFLVHGGSVAHDFLGRCLEMAESALDGLSVPPADQLGLPQRIVDEFGKWLNRARPPKRTLTESSGVRYIKPTLSYDPWLPDALNLTLPSQPRGQNERPLTWSVTTDSRSRRIDAVSSGSLPKTTRQIEVRIDSPFRFIEIGLNIGDQIIRTWRFTGITKSRPFLIFSPDTGRFAESLQELTPSEWWLVAPSTSSLSTRRGGSPDELQVIEQFPALAGKWNRYVGRHISLVNRAALVLNTENNSVEIPVKSPDDVAQRPLLMGGTPSTLPLILEAAQSAYQVRAPMLVLPLRLKGDRRISPGLWRIHLASMPGAEPRVDTRFIGDDPLLVSVSEHTAQVNLALSELLGPEPVGRFHLTARGPLGLDADFEIIVTPDVQVLGLREIITPSEDAKEAATFYVIADGIVRPAEPDGAVVEPSHLGYSVAIPSSLDQANLLIATQSRLGKVANVELPFLLQRLRWALTGVSEHESIFSDRQQMLSIDEIEQADTPSLVLDLPRLDEALNVAARLEDVSGNVLFTYAQRPISKSRRFSLRELLDTIRNRSDSHLRLCVLVWDGGAGREPKRVVVADITRSLQISDLHVSDQLSEYGRAVQLFWTDAHPVTNRVIRFWPLWRPWEQEPLEVAIPDDAHGCHTMVIDSSRLVPGDYRVEFAVIDPWVGAALASPPSQKAGNQSDVEIGSEAERRTYIDSPTLHEPLSLLERFLATRDPHWLPRLEETLGVQDVRSALLAAMSILDAADAGLLRSGSSLQDIMATLQPILLESNELLSALARLSGSTQSKDHKLRRLTVELGLLRENQSVLSFQSLADAERQSLSNLWTPLQTVVSEQGSERIADPPSGSQTKSMGNAQGITKAGGDGPQAWTAPFKFDGQELQRDPGLLRVMRDALSLLPSSPLDDDFWTIANFDWLIRVKEDGELEGRAKKWARDCFSAALADIDRMQGVLPEAVLHISSRFPTATDDPLGKIPLLVGATALVERAAARGALEFSELLREIPRGNHSPRESFEIAVELYTRDLCLMDALITYELEKGLQGAVRA